MFVHADYTVPVDAIRTEVTRLCKASPNWDGKVVGVQVTEATDHAVVVRALMSSADASKNWDLRCEVREKLIAFLQKNHPQCLPRVRLDGNPGPGGTARPGPVPGLAG